MAFPFIESLSNWVGNTPNCKRLDCIISLVLEKPSGTKKVNIYLQHVLNFLKDKCFLIPCEISSSPKIIITQKYVSENKNNKP